MHDIPLNVGGLFGGIAGLIAAVVLMIVMRDENGPPA
jgi:hypothetical protein